MDTNIITFSSVEAMTAKPLVLRQEVGRVMKADDDACYIECLPFLTPPGQAGSSQFDHCEVASILLKHDAEHGGAVAKIMKLNSMSKVQLWKVIERALRVAGFEMARGRVVGVLEDKSDRAAEVDAVVVQEAAVVAV